jgi:hypothetical protein
MLFLSSAGNEHSEAGLLSTKYLHSQNSLAFMQKIDYRYNVRGWLTGINEPILNLNEGDKFGMKIGYNRLPASTANVRYNGNISGIQWSSPIKANIGYRFSYDGANHLTASSFNEAGTDNMKYYTHYMYDKNGNFTNLVRVNGSNVTSAKKALVVIDAGIATEKNLAMIKAKGYDYLCVSRSTLKDDKMGTEAETVTVTDNKGHKIALCRVKSDSNTDCYLRVESPTKELKERSMNQQFRERFEEGLKKIADSLTKKGGVKQEDKVHERIGRLKQKYPSIQHYFDIELEVKEEVAVKGKKKGKEAVQEKKRVAVSMKWQLKEGVDINARSGVYFLRTSLETDSEAVLWQFYNIIREIEATFRTLKTELDLRPIFHQKDENTMAHLHLGLLAYWVVNTVRHQLKMKGYNHDWREIVRTMNTQKAVTTMAQNANDQVIIIRRCSEPNPKVRAIYDALRYKYAPFIKRKSVVHKSELEKNQFIEKQFFSSV